jgi:voltage-gated potassium channel
MHFHRLIGLTGVAAHETAAARRWGYRLEWPMLLVALWIPVQWYLEVKHSLPSRFILISDWLIWLFFLGETTFLATLVRNKLEYLIDNWMNVVIIIAGIPLLWSSTPMAGELRALRLFLMLALLIRFSTVLQEVLRRNQLGVTLVVALLIVLVAGVLLSTIDPNIQSIGDGIWYAWVTMATVGYGDVVPTSLAGRILGGILIFLGMVLFSLITANIAAFLLSGNVERVEKDMEKVEKEESELSRRLDRIQKQLDRIERQLERSETRKDG